MSSKIYDLRGREREGKTEMDWGKKGEGNGRRQIGRDREREEEKGRKRETKRERETKRGKREGGSSIR